MTEKKSFMAERQAEEAALMKRLSERLSHIAVTVLVLSGKGGVGKSTVAVNLAWSLSARGKRIGLLDIDMHGPSVPGLLGLEGFTAQQQGETLLPAIYSDSLKVMSIGFFLPTPDEAVIWRGPLKYSMIRQFLANVEWGDLDFLVIDSPPGTGDEPLSIVQILGGADGAVIVTTPQKVAISEVRKCINFCRRLKLPIIGVVENMSGFVCPSCGTVTEIFRTGGGEAMAADMGVPFLARVPLDPNVVTAGERGEPYVKAFSASPAASAFQAVVNKVANIDKKSGE